MSLIEIPSPLMSVQDKVRREFLRDLKGGVYPEGSVLPAERTLARKYDVSVAAVHRMLGEMNEAGTIRTVRSKGSYVLAAPGNGADPAIENKLIKATLTLPTEAHFGSETVVERESLSRETDHAFLLDRPEYRIRYRPYRAPLKSPLLGYREAIAEMKGCSVVRFRSPAMPMLVTESEVADLSGMAAEAGIERIYDPGIWEHCWRRGHLIGLPVRVINPLVIFYNRELLARHAPGINPETLTWDEFLAVADAVAAGANLDTPVTMSHELVPATWILTLLAQVNGYTQLRDAKSWRVRFDSGAFIEAFGKVREAFLRFRMAEIPDLWSNRELVYGLCAGRNCFHVADTLYRPTDPNVVGVMPIPTLTGGTTRFLATLVMAGIRRGNSPAVRDAAWEYLLFHARPEYAAQACRRGVEHPRRLVYRPEYVAGHDLKPAHGRTDGFEPFMKSDAPLSECSLEPISLSFNSGILTRLFLLEVLFSRTTDWQKRALDLVEGVNESNGEFIED